MAVAPEAVSQAQGKIMPRFLFILRADSQSESTVLPPPEVFTEMHAYNAELMSAGAMIGGEGLTPSSQGARVIFPSPSSSSSADTASSKAQGDLVQVTNGPFPCEGTERLMAGYWLIKAKDLEEAVGWAKKAPLRGTELEVRRVFEMEDCAEQMPEEVRKEEEGWREKLEGRK
ncbi:MAG: hypothetical protein Q9167_007218 [Letrouitia subvulpina]